MTPRLMTIAQIADETGVTVKGVQWRIKIAHVRAVKKRGRLGLYRATGALMQPSDRMRGAYIAEDAQWLADDGTGFTEASRRLGYKNPKSFERLLYRRGENRLMTQLKANESRTNKEAA